MPRDYGVEEEQDSKVKPTEEQREALRLFKLGGDLKMEAGAGTGKTSTLVMLAKSVPGKLGQYVAFNKGIVEDSKAKMPTSVQCNTAHSLAFKVVGRRFGHRLGGFRMKPSELASRLKLRTIQVNTPFSSFPKSVEPWQQAGMVKAAVSRFCQSADKEVDAKHFPYVEGIDGKGSYANNAKLAQQLVEVARGYWKDVCSPDGVLPYAHEHYLKLWEQSRPVIQAGYVLVDEAQDVAPVLLSIIQQQREAQVVWVGDACQEIYAWAGAVNAMERIRTEHECFLTKSFRFGQPVAEWANRVLERIEGARLRLTGCEKKSTVGRLEKAKAVLSRTNATAVEGILSDLKRGVRSHLVGGGEDVIRFCEAAEQLKQGRKVSHPDLQCFDTWAEVLDYVKDEAGRDLKLQVQLVNRYGGRVIAEALRGMPSEERAETVYSTAHKAKGREWETVRLAGDFNSQNDEKGNPPSDAELKLLYVAGTRAKMGLDPEALGKQAGGEE